MIDVTRKLAFNLGRFEQHEFTVTLTGIPMDADPEEIAAKLDLLFAPEVERAQLATSHVPSENTSSVYTWREITDKAKEGPHA